jgi:putative transposase
LASSSGQVLPRRGANKAAIDAINVGRDVPIVVRQVKYLNNIVEQDQSAIKRVTRPMLNFKSFRCAGCVLAGVELMHMIRKGQVAIDDADAMSFADQFYALAGMVRPV